MWLRTAATTYCGCTHLESFFFCDSLRFVAYSLEDFSLKLFVALRYVFAFLKGVASLHSLCGRCYIYTAAVFVFLFRLSWRRCFVCCRKSHVQIVFKSRLSFDTVVFAVCSRTPRQALSHKRVLYVAYTREKCATSGQNARNIPAISLVAI